jgi:peptide/histidine transporter 3/4
VEITCSSSFVSKCFVNLGLISSHSFVNNAVVFLWMDYFIDLGQPLPLAAIAMNVQEGLYVICTFIIANVADAYTGPYKAIVFSTASYAFVSRSILYIYICARARA